MRQAYKLLVAQKQRSELLMKDYYKKMDAVTFPNLRPKLTDGHKKIHQIVKSYGYPYEQHYYET